MSEYPVRTEGSSPARAGEAARQFRVLCSDKNYWIYLVIPGPPSQIFTFRRDEVLPFIRSYIHFDFFYKKRFLSSARPSG
jgi:hypothetical protein